MKSLFYVAAATLTLGIAGPAAATQALAQKNACLSCHGVDKKIVGPSFKDVAKKYAGDKSAHAKLVAKVKTGGKGVWGDIPMPPNPQVKPEDSAQIITWVLGLK